MFSFWIQPRLECELIRRRERILCGDTVNAKGDDGNGLRRHHLGDERELFTRVLARLQDVQRQAQLLRTNSAFVAAGRSVNFDGYAQRGHA